MTDTKLHSPADRLMDIQSRLATLEIEEPLDRLAPEEWRGVQEAQTRLGETATAEAMQNCHEALDRLEQGLRVSVIDYSVLEAMVSRVSGAVAGFVKVIEQQPTPPVPGISLHELFRRHERARVASTPQASDEYRSRAENLMEWFEKVWNSNAEQQGTPAHEVLAQTINDWVREFPKDKARDQKLWLSLARVSDPLTVALGLLRAGKAQEFSVLLKSFGLDLDSQLALARTQPDQIQKFMVDLRKQYWGESIQQMTDDDKPFWLEANNPEMERASFKLIRDLAGLEDHFAREFLCEIAETAHSPYVSLKALEALASRKDARSSIEVSKLANEFIRSCGRKWAFQHKDSQIRASVMTVLGLVGNFEMGYFEAGNLLRDKLIHNSNRYKRIDGNSCVRMAALVALVRLGDSHWAETLQEIFKTSASEAERATAFKGLLTINTGPLKTDDVWKFIWALADPSELIRATAYRYLRPRASEEHPQGNGPTGVDATRAHLENACLQDPSPMVRAAALEALLDLDGLAQADLLYSMSLNDQASWVQQAVRAIKRGMLDGKYGIEASATVFLERIDAWWPRIHDLRPGNSRGPMPSLDNLGSPVERLDLVATAKTLSVAARQDYKDFGSGPQASPVLRDSWHEAGTLLLEIATADPNSEVRLAATLARYQLMPGIARNTKARGDCLVALVLEAMATDPAGPSYPSGPAPEGGIRHERNSEIDRRLAQRARSGGSLGKKSSAPVTGVTPSPKRETLIDLQNRIGHDELATPLAPNRLPAATGVAQSAKLIQRRGESVNAVSSLIRSQRGVGPAGRYYAVPNMVGATKAARTYRFR